MSERPASLVSVVVPAYNAAPYLRSAIESVLAQAHRPLDVIVVDDGSEDATAEVARSFGPEVRVFVQPRSGAGAARNRAVDEVRGGFLAFLDADDAWTPWKLASQLACFDQDPALDYTLGHVVEFRRASDGTVSERPPMAAAMPGAMLIRTGSYHRVGRLRTDLRVGEFIDWFARARELGLRSQMIPEVVLRRRVHDTNLGIRERSGRKDYAEVVRAALARRRVT